MVYHVEGYCATCDPSVCLSQIPNFFLRPESNYLLTREDVESLCGISVYGKLDVCWETQCREAIQTDRAIRDLIQQSRAAIRQLCASSQAKAKLAEATGKCRIFYPHQSAPQWSQVNDCRLRSAIKTKRQAESWYPPTITDNNSGWQWSSRPNNPYDLSGPPVLVNSQWQSSPSGDILNDETPKVVDPIVQRPVFVNYLGATGTNWLWPSQAGYQTQPGGVVQNPFVIPGDPSSSSSSFLLPSLPVSAVIPAVGICLEVSALMDCTLSRSCAKDLAQVLKPMAMVYLGCISAVPSSLVCDATRVRYCMQLSGGSPFDIFEPSRFQQYCQSSTAMTACIDQDCPPSTTGASDQQLLTNYKRFLQSYCQDTSYQNSVIAASTVCPLFRNTTVFPATTDSVTCATDLLNKQGKEKNFCNILEANTLCLGTARRCDYTAVNPQKSVLLQMSGCEVSGTLRYEPETSSTTPHAAPGLHICMATIILLTTSVFLKTIKL